MNPGPAVLAAAILFAGGCVGPTDDTRDAPLMLPGLVPSGWRPTEGVQWGNLTGTLDPGQCEAFGAFAPPPVIQAWWLQATPNVTLAIANWTTRAPGELLCHDVFAEGVRVLHDIRATHESEEIASGREGYEFAFVCEATVPCEMTWWSQQIRPLNPDDGTRRWPASVGPAPVGYRE